MIFVELISLISEPLLVAFWALLAAPEASLTSPELSCFILCSPTRSQSYLVPGPHLSYHGLWPPQGSASNSKNPSSLRMAGNLGFFHRGSEPISAILGFSEGTKRTLELKFVIFVEAHF